MLSNPTFSLFKPICSLLFGIFALGCGQHAGDSEKSETKIKNGTLFQVQDQLYRPVVSLYTRVDDDTASHCTGTILAPHWVLTAAHCVSNRTYTDTKVSAYKGSRHKPFAVYHVKEVVLPNGVTMDDNGTYWNGDEAGFALPKLDLALLRLDRDIPLDGSLVAARLPNALDASAIGGLQGYAVGAGLHDDQPNDEQILKWASATITNYDFTNDRLVASPSISDQGDSGGPFLTLNSIDHRPVIWGVYSLSRGLPLLTSDEYTDVGFNHRRWIESTIQR